MLAGLGVAGDVDPGDVFVEDLDDLVDEVVDDLYVRKYVDRARAAAVRAAPRRCELARAAVGDPQARLEPADRRATASAAASRGSGSPRPCAPRSSGASGGRRVVTYDDLLTRLEAHADRRRTGPRPAHGCASATGWCSSTSSRTPTRSSGTILRRAFHGARTLVLIGDPKQAIYAFRGADVSRYLDAAGAAGTTHATLADELAQRPAADRRARRGLRRRRSSATRGSWCARSRPAHDTVPAASGCPGRPACGCGCCARDAVRPAGDHRARRRDVPPAHRARDSRPRPQRRLLASGAGPSTPRPVEPGDVAVLVRTNTQAAAGRDALAAVGVPAVITGGGSVFATPGGRRVAHPARGARAAAPVRARCAPPRSRRFLGRTAVDAGRPRRAGSTTRCADRLRDWAGLLRDCGAWRRCWRRSATQRSLARVLARADGERRLTDLRHVAQAPARRPRWSTGSGWSRCSRLAAATASPRPTVEVADERTRRLESDAEAVQVLTDPPQQGPRVPDRLPARSGADRCGAGPRRPPATTTTTGAGSIDVGGGRSGLGPATVRAAHRAEEAGESLRLLYVALTRAQSPGRHLVGAGQQRQHLPAAPAALRARAGHARGPGRAPAAHRRRGRGGLRGLAVPGGPASERSAPAPLSGAGRCDPRASCLRRGPFDRTVDTALAAHLLHRAEQRRVRPGARAGVSSEPEVVPRDDEPDRAPSRAPRPRTPATRSRRRWPPCRSGRPSARSCTACSRPPTRGGRPRGRARRPRPRAAGPPAGRPRPRRARRRAGRGRSTPLGPLAGDVRLRDCRRRPARRARVRAAARRR